MGCDIVFGFDAGLAVPAVGDEQAACGSGVVEAGDVVALGVERRVGWITAQSAIPCTTPRVRNSRSMMLCTDDFARFHLGAIKSS